MMKGVVIIFCLSLSVWAVSGISLYQAKLKLVALGDSSSLYSEFDQNGDDSVTLDELQSLRSTRGWDGNMDYRNAILTEIINAAKEQGSGPADKYDFTDHSIVMTASAPV